MNWEILTYAILGALGWIGMIFFGTAATFVFGRWSAQLLGWY